MAARENLSKVNGAIVYLGKLKRRETHSSRWVRRFLMPADKAYDDSRVLRKAIAKLKVRGPCWAAV